MVAGEIWKGEHKIAIPQRMTSGVILPQVLPTMFVRQSLSLALLNPRNPPFPISLLLRLQVHATMPAFATFSRHFKPRQGSFISRRLLTQTGSLRDSSNLRVYPGKNEAPK